MSNLERSRILRVLALMAYAAILASMLAPEVKADPYYTKEQLLEVVPLVHTVVSIGAYNKRAAELGLTEQKVVPMGSIYHYCQRKPGYETLACTWNGAIWLSRGAGKGTILHELKHVRRQFIEGRSNEAEYNHIGW